MLKVPPIEYAEKIIEAVADASIADAKSAMKIATELLEYRFRGECAETLASLQAHPAESRI